METSTSLLLNTTTTAGAVANYLPIDVRAKVLAANCAPSDALDGRAVFSWDVAAGKLPLADSALGHAQLLA